MIRENVLSVLETIKDAALTAGTTSEEIRLIAVTKTVEIEQICEALSAGVREIGENRVQELCRKEKLLSSKPVFHLIGHLQTNKVRDAVGVADFIHSVDSLHLAQELQKQCEKISKKMPVLIQVNTSGEESKFGVSPSEVFSLAEAIIQMSHLELRGIMTIAPKTDHPDTVRPIFAETRALYEKLAERFVGDVKLDMLSMGMTNDYLAAIAEGANVVRVGRAIFGERHYG